MNLTLQVLAFQLEAASWRLEAERARAELASLSRAATDDGNSNNRAALVGKISAIGLFL